MNSLGIKFNEASVRFNAFVNGWHKDTLTYSRIGSICACAIASFSFLAAAYGLDGQLPIAKAVLLTCSAPFLCGIAILSLPEIRSASLMVYNTAARVLNFVTKTLSWHTTPKEIINYELLRDYGIDPKAIDTYEREIAQKNYGKFHGLVKIIADSSASLIATFKGAKFFPWFFLHLQETKETLDKNLCEKLLINFQKNQLFQFSHEHIEAKCKNQKKIKLNRLAMYLASEFIRKKLNSKDFSEVDKNKLDFSEYSSLAVQTLEKFLLNALEKFLLNGELRIIFKSYTLDVLVDILDLARFLGVAGLEGHALKSIEAFLTNRLGQKIITNEKQLTDFLEYLSKYKAKIADEELIAKVEFQAFSSYFISYDSTTPFNFVRNQFVIPFRALHLLKKDDDIGIYLRDNVNCISFPKDVNEIDLDKLKLLRLYIPQENIEKMVSVVHTDGNDDSTRAAQVLISSIFLNVKTIYFVTTKVIEDANNILKLARGMDLVYVGNENLKIRGPIETILKMLTEIEIEFLTEQTFAIYGSSIAENLRTSLPAFEKKYSSDDFSISAKEEYSGYPLNIVVKKLIKV